jgi:predicted transcriptional regulator
MKLEAIKLELIEWLTTLENEGNIAYLKIIKDSLTKNDWYEGLMPEQKSGIERGLKDIDENRVTPHEDVKKRFGL